MKNLILLLFPCLVIAQTQVAYKYNIDEIDKSFWDLLTQTDKDYYWNIANLEYQQGSKYSRMDLSDWEDDLKTIPDVYEWRDVKMKPDFPIKEFINSKGGWKNKLDKKKEFEGKFNYYRSWEQTAKTTIEIGNDLITTTVYEKDFGDEFCVHTVTRKNRVVTDILRACTDF